MTLVLLPVLSFPALSAAINCQGEATHSYISSSGALVVRTTYRGDYTNMCNVNGDPIVCSLWTSIITSSITNDTPIIVRYGDIVSCDSIPTYGAAPKPQYVVIVKDNL